MEFKLINGRWAGFRDDEYLGEFVQAETGSDDRPYFYFRPADQLLSCRDCRKAVEKLTELNAEPIGLMLSRQRR